MNKKKNNDLSNFIQLCKVNNKMDLSERKQFIIKNNLNCKTSK